MTEFSTPLMRQYSSIKDRHPDALLLFRLGDFYELFFEDAVVASKELQITLTSRNKEKGAAIPMCGVPYHAAEGYIAKLIRRGYRVAVCDQVDDPRVAKKLVKREVTRVVTPGTAIDPQVLEARHNNYLAALIEQESGVGLVFADLSTGDFRATEFRGADAGARCRERLQVEPVPPAGNSHGPILVGAGNREAALPISLADRQPSCRTQRGGQADRTAARHDGGEGTNAFAKARPDSRGCNIQGGLSVRSCSLPTHYVWTWRTPSSAVGGRR